MRIHIVQKGDTLWKLAQKYNVDFEAIKAANHHLSNPDLIMPGMKVKIPSGKVQATKKPKEKEAPMYGWQVDKKEHQIAKEIPKEIVKEKPKETPKKMPKEMPEVKKLLPPSFPEEKVQPMPMPTPLPVPPQAPVVHEHPSYHLQKTNMNVNIYKQKKDTDILIQTKVPETPLKIESPIEAPEAPEMPVKEIEPPPIVEEMPVAKPSPCVDTSMYAHCYPVSPVYHSGPAPYYPKHSGWQMKQQVGMAVHPYQQMPAPIMPAYGQPPQFYDPSSQGKDGQVEKEVDVAKYGDVTAQQYQTNQAPTQYGHYPTYMQANMQQQPFTGMGGYPSYMQGYAPPANTAYLPYQQTSYQAAKPYAYYREDEHNEEE